MASEEVRKKWGTIFMGEREASVEQLNAMQEHVNRDKLQKEQTENYMERVRARAVERAREILGEAYTERQKVLEEAKGEAVVQKRLAAQECARIKSEGEAIRKQAQEELERAQAEKDEATKIRESAYGEGYQEGMNQAGAELHEFRAEMGQAVASLLRAIERERKNILENWRNELAELVKAATQAGTGLILQKEHEAILRQLVFQSLDMLENRTAISVRVNPQDEETVSDMFRAARERAPELKQWTVTGDESIEPGGLVAESGTGSVDYRRANFREMVDGVLCHLGLPEHDSEAEAAQDVASLVEQEVAHIASMTPELETAATQEEVPETAGEIVESSAPEEAVAGEALQAPDEVNTDQEETNISPAPQSFPEDLAEIEEDLADDLGALEPEAAVESKSTNRPDPSLAELEDELFPLDEQGADQSQTAAPKAQAQESADSDAEIDPKTLAEGGFL